MKQAEKIVVIGGGLAGISSAYWLHQAGYRVTVIDQEAYPAMGASRANGGQLSACNAGVWTTWHMVIKGLGWMGRPGAPLLINPTPTPSKISWLGQFLWHTLKGDADDRTTATAAAAIASRAALAEMAKTCGVDYDHETRGILHTYRDQASLDTAVAAGEVMTKAGVEWQPLNADEVVKLEPSLAASNLVGGILTPSDSTGDAHKFCLGVAKWLSKHGVDFVWRSRVAKILPKLGEVGVVTDRGENLWFDHVVMANGVDAPRLAWQAGTWLSIYPVKGYSITVDLHTRASQRGAPWVSILDDDAKIVATRLGPRRLRVAGTAELNGVNLDIRRDRIVPLLEWTERVFPLVELRSYKPWAGLRPMTPNMMPRVGSTRHPRVWLCCGFGHLGWTLAPGMAKGLAHAVSQGPTTKEFWGLTPFDG